MHIGAIGPGERDFVGRARAVFAPRDFATKDTRIILIDEVVNASADNVVAGAPQKPAERGVDVPADQGIVDIPVTLLGRLK